MWFDLLDSWNLRPFIYLPERSARVPPSSGKIWLWLALLVACGMQLFEVPSRAIDPDEFEHLHAAFCVHQGLLPYRDFFEHHGPLLYYVLQPLFWLCGDDLSVLWLGRLAMWCCSLGTLALTGAIARRVADTTTGLAAATLLAWSTVFHLKGIELRPDVPAAFLLTLAFWLSLPPTGAAPDRARAWQSWFLIGLLCGLATLFTQKSIVPTIGLAVAACIGATVVGRPRQGVLIVGGMLAGGAVCWLAACGCFALRHGLGEFLRSTIERLWTWPLRSRRWDALRPTLVADLTIWFAAVFQIVGVVRAWRVREVWSSGLGQTSVACLLAIVSLAAVKAVYAQFYLLWFPLLAVLAGVRLVGWSRLSPGRSWRAGMRCVKLLGCLVIAAQVALCLRAYHSQQAGALPSLVEWAAGMIPADPIADGMVVATGFFVGTWLLCGRHKWTTVVAVVSAIGMVHAALRIGDAFLWLNSRQVEAVAEVHRQVPSEQTVLDGFSGYAALRSHAYYYWWINEYSLALMSADERGSKLLSTLQAKPPAAVLFDDGLEHLPEEVTTWIRGNYVRGDSAAARQARLWLRHAETPPEADRGR